MISFVCAHGYDPGPTQRPLVAGAIAGLLATIPAGATLSGFGSFAIAADQVLRLPQAWTAVVMMAAFTLAGLIYGAFFRRAANDPRAGWLLGLSYGFVLWIAAPVVALPLIGASATAGGHAAIGFALSFLIWGLAAGILFPYVHRPLQAGLDGVAGSTRRFGAEQGAVRRRLPGRR
jgi:hypothetical protein